jgi:hypothetical protein
VRLNLNQFPFLKLGIEDPNWNSFEEPVMPLTRGLSCVKRPYDCMVRRTGSGLLPKS